MTTSTIDNLIKNGLPSWVYTWRTVFAISLLGPFVVMILGSTISTLGGLFIGPSTHAPDCFTIKADPLVPGTRLFDPAREDSEKFRSNRNKTVSNAIAAVNACQPGACSGELLKTYQRAARNYMSTRGQASQSLFVTYGDAGLSYAETLYDTPQDIALVQALRQGFEVGLLDISRLRGDEAIVRMLLFKPLDKLQLCRSRMDKVCQPGRISC